MLFKLEALAPPAGRANPYTRAVFYTDNRHQRAAVSSLTEAKKSEVVPPVEVII